MDDEEKPKGPDRETIIFFVIIGLVVFGPAIWAYVAIDPSYISGSFYVLKKIIGILIAISIPLSLIFIIGIIVSVERLKEIRKKEKLIYDRKVEPAYDINAKGDPQLAMRWQSVTKHIESPNQNDWKQAIIEADVILDELLTKMGYHGESVGEKLKRVEPADFNTLQQAWEAHKIRNRIAHDGAAFVFNQHEAKRIIQLYKQVFEEFYYI